MHFLHRGHTVAMMRTVLGALMGAAMTLGLVVVMDEQEAPNLVELAPDPYGSVHELVVAPIDDAGRAGTVHGVIGQRYFTSTDGGESPDSLAFRFTAPARLVRVQVSVDIGTGAHLVEFAVGINGDGYAVEGGGGEDRSASWLLHTSYSGTEGGSTDEAVDLPPGVEVAAGDAVTVGAWLNGDLPVRVSPEVIVLYEWLTSPPGA